LDEEVAQRATEVVASSPGDERTHLSSTAQPKVEVSCVQSSNPPISCKLLV